MLVSFIVVALNAGQTIDKLIEDIKKQDYKHKEIEIIFIDGNSVDNTKRIMMDFKKSEHDFNRVSVLDNPKKTLPCGWNIALKESKGDVILRVDAHSSLPTNFIRNNVDCIRSGEKIVGGHRISIIDSVDFWQKTLLIAESSLFGSGIASYRRTKEKKYVSTLAHAAYSREVFQSVGGYDERLARTEDNEMHYRMKKSGYKFLLDPSIKSYHHARNKLSKMVKQKFLNGYWIGLTLGVSPKCFSLYHFIPFVFVSFLLVTLFLCLEGNNILILYLLLLYGAFASVNTFLSIRKKFNLNYLILPFLFFILHVSYGLGTLFGLLKLPAWLIKNRIANEQSGGIS